MRYEFTKKTKRIALERAEKRCEAIGGVYGLPDGKRCNYDLSYGVEFDHYPLPAGVKGSNDPENCVAVCITCHKFKTRTFDIPMQAKDKRIRDKHNGIKGPKKKWPSRGFTRPEPNVKYLNEDLEI